MDGKKERRSRGQILRNLMFVWLALAYCATQCECRAQKEGERTNFGLTKAAQSKSGLSMWTYNVLSCISALHVCCRSHENFSANFSLSLWVDLVHVRSRLENLDIKFSNWWWLDNESAAGLGERKMSVAKNCWIIYKFVYRSAHRVWWCILDHQYSTSDFMMKIAIYNFPH